MPILEELLIRGYINIKDCEKHEGKQKIKCPKCAMEYNLEDGIYKCTSCENYFRKIGLATYDCNDVTISTIDYIIHLLTYCAKSDGKITSKERDYIIDYINSFNLNEGQESFAYAQYDYARFTDYNKETILLLKNSIEQLAEDDNIIEDILNDILNIILLDCDDFNEKQGDIINDYLDIFEIPTEICEEMIKEIYKTKKKNKKENTNKNIKKDDINQYYEILGLEEGCSEHDLKKRYAELTRSYHPDKYSSDDIPSDVKKQFEDMYKKINLAYDKIREKI